MDFGRRSIEGRGRWRSKDQTNRISLEEASKRARYMGEREALILWESIAIDVCSVGAGINKNDFDGRHSTINKNTAVVLEW